MSGKGASGITGATNSQDIDNLSLSSEHDGIDESVGEEEFMGSLHHMDVRPVPNPSTGAQIRDAFGAIIGGAGCATFIHPKDSTAVVGKKVIGTASTCAASLIANARLGTARLSGVLPKIAAVKGVKPDQLPGFKPAVLAEAVKPIAFVHGVYNGAVAVKKAYDISAEVAMDLVSHNDRVEFQALLKDFDVKTGKFKSSMGGYIEDPERYARLMLLRNKHHQLAEKILNAPEGGSVYRNKTQRALDVGSKIRDWVPSAALPAGSLMGFATMVMTNPAAQLATAGTGLSVAAHGALAVVNFGKTAIQMAAIANIESARQESINRVEVSQIGDEDGKTMSTNQLLVGLSNRMIQERTYKARASFWTGVAFAFSSISSGVGLASGGIGYIASSLASCLTLIATTGFTTGFDVWHSRKLAERRSHNADTYNSIKDFIGDMEEVERRDFFRSLDHKSAIGILERLTLDALRDGTVEEYEEVHDFLLACGISENTIKSFVIEPDANKALGMLQDQLYTARTHFTRKSLTYMPEAIGYVSGVTYFKRWLERKLNAPAEVEEVDAITEQPRVVAKDVLSRSEITTPLPAPETIKENLLGRPKLRHEA